jgi:archaellum component FlaG (FlaF/FlaG flagellin family)
MAENTGDSTTDSSVMMFIAGMLLFAIGIAILIRRIQWMEARVDSMADSLTEHLSEGCEQPVYNGKPYQPAVHVKSDKDWPEYFDESL